MKLNPVVAAGLLLYLALPGCLNIKQPMRTVMFYALEYQPADAGAHPALPAVVSVGEFRVAPEYNTNRIVYRDAAYRRSAYSYHKWRAHPGDAVPYFLARDMKASGLFKGVLARGYTNSAHYTVTGTIDEFFERDTRKGWEAVLTVGITFFAKTEGSSAREMISQETYTVKRPCKEEHPASLAEAMSMAMAELSARVIHDLYLCIRSALENSGAP